MDVRCKSRVLGIVGLALWVTCAALADPVGEFPWAASAGGPGMDRGRGVAAMPDGGCVAVGHFADSIVFASGTASERTWESVGGVDAWIARFDADGQAQWSRGIGSLSNDVAAGVARAGDGGVLVSGAYRGVARFAAGETGETILDCSGAQDGFAAHYAGDGGLVSVLRVGGTGEDAAGGVAPIPGGGFYLTGFFQGSMRLGQGEPNETQFSSAGGSDIFLARFSSDNSLVWARRMGSTDNDEGQSLAATSDGGVVVSGVIRGTAVFGAGEAHATTLWGYAPYTAFVARYSPSGSLVWAKAPTNAGGWIGGGNVAALPDDSVYLTGEFSGLVVFGQRETTQTSLSCEEANGFLARYGADGRFDWVVSLGVDGETVHGRAVDVLPDGRAVVAGMYFGAATFGRWQARETHLSSGAVASYDIYLAGYNSDGLLEWAQSVGGPGVDYAFGVSAMDGGGVIFTGQLTDTATLGAHTLTSAGAEDVLLARFDPSAEPIPVPTYTPTPTPTPGGGGWSASAGDAEGGGASGMMLGVAGDGGVIVAGEFNTRAVFGRGEPNETQFSGVRGDVQTFVARYQPAGMLAWAKAFHGTFAGQRPEGIAVRQDGGTLLCGSFEGPTLFGAGEVNATTLECGGVKDMFVARFNPDGNLAWVKRAGGPSLDQGYSVAFTSDGGAAVAGSFMGSCVFGPGESGETTATTDRTAMFVARYRPDGTLAWVATSTGGQLAEGMAVALGTGGKLLVGGSFAGAVAWGSGEAQAITLQAGSTLGTFLACFNDNGTLAWARHVAGGPSYHVVRRVMVRADGSIQLAGQSQVRITLAPGQPEERTLTPTRGSDMWIARLDATGKLQTVQVVGRGENAILCQAALAADGSVKIAGFFSQYFFGYGLSSAGQNDVFAASVGPSGPAVWTGIVLWAGRLGGGGDDQALDIAPYGSNRIVLTGRFQGDVVMDDWGRGSKVLRAESVWDMFVAVLGRPPMPYGGVYAAPPSVPPTPTPTPTLPPTPTPTVGPEQLMMFVLDDYGAVHTGGAANHLALTGGPYFGWNIARSMALVQGLPALNDSHLGVLVLDGYGAVHGYSASRPPQNFYFSPVPGDVAMDLEVFQADLAGIPGNVGFFVLDRSGKLWAAGEADPAVAAAGGIDPPLNAVAQYAVDLLLADQHGTSGWIMDNMGNVHPFGGAVAPAFAVSAQNNWKRVVRVDGQLVRMDAAGNLEWSGEAKAGWEVPVVDGDLMVDLEVEEGLGLVALDRFGAVYASDKAVLPLAGQGPPYFGVEAARDLELGPPFDR